MLQLLRCLPTKTKGKIRLGRFIVKGVKGPRLLGILHDLKLTVPSMLEPIAYHLAANGEYEPDTRDAVKANLHEGGLFIDVGANVGSICLPVSKCRPDTNALAIEASRLIFQYLQHNININNIGNCIAENCCAGESNGYTSFYPARNDAFGSGNRSGGPSECERVPMRTLDELTEAHGFSRVDVLKVDVEGWEYFVLEGAKKILGGHPSPTVIFEFNDWSESGVGSIEVGDAQRFLISLGYSIWTLGNYLSGLPENEHVLETGSDMLIAKRA